MQGGCGWFGYLDDIYASDTCASSTFDEAVATDAIDTEPGADLALVPADGWRIGSDPALGVDWSVHVADASRLSGKKEQFYGFPPGTGTELASGTATRRVIRVHAPASRGDYLVQLDAPFWRDGYSNMTGTFYWHIRVP